jgi:hypothetical protein
MTLNINWFPHYGILDEEALPEQIGLTGHHDIFYRIQF